MGITSKTVIEMIAERPQASLPSIDLTSWKNAPNGKILKSDMSLLRITWRRNKLKTLNELWLCFLIALKTKLSKQFRCKWKTGYKRAGCFPRIQWIWYSLQPRKSVIRSCNPIGWRRIWAFPNRTGSEFMNIFEKEAKWIVKREKVKRP